MLRLQKLISIIFKIHFEELSKIQLFYICIYIYIHPPAKRSEHSVFWKINTKYNKNEFKQMPIVIRCKRRFLWIFSELYQTNAQCAQRWKILFFHFYFYHVKQSYSEAKHSALSLSERILMLLFILLEMRWFLSSYLDNGG